MTLQGMRKASFNAFKMLSYLGPKRLLSGGGVGGDGVDAMATMSASDDEIQILVYDYYATLNTTGTDMVTVTLNNLPPAMAGKDLFLTHFRADETHSNPYSIWTSQGSPKNPTEAQWQAMKAHQHLELLQPVSTVTASDATYTTTFSIPRQAGSLVILGVNRPVTGRNGLVEIEGEDYDGQSGATKEDSGDTTLGQSIAASAGSYVFFNNVDFTDGGVNGVQLRVNAQNDTTIELRADSQTGTLLGTCQVAATAGSWASQMCSLTPTTGVHTVYVAFADAVRLNYIKFQPVNAPTGTGGAGGDNSGAGGSGTGSSGVGGSNSGTGGSTPAKSGSGCSCAVGGDIGPTATLLAMGVLAAVWGFRRRKR